LLRAATVLGDELVFDAEIIAPGLTGRADFAALQKRLGRSGPDLFLEEEIPVRCVVFDLLRHNGESLLRVPLRQRREMLAAVRLPSLFSLIPVWRASDRSGLERAFLEARDAGLEGLIIKDPESPYAAGSRGRSWLKLKRSPLSLDVVVTAVQQGHGKRSHLLSDFTFAVRDAHGALRNIGKAYSGLTDAELEELTEHFTRQTVSIDGRLRTVVPDTVLEVTFDSIQPSGRHDSGYALRFPRIRALRRDKTPAEIDTMDEAARLAEVCAMAGRQAGKSAGGNDRMLEA
jgi:DNA ligase-1